jgi:hypothetical protein
MSARHEAERLLADLLAAGCIPVIEQERLRIEAPPGALTAARRRSIEAALPELRAIVASKWRSRERCVARRPCRQMGLCAEPNDGRPCVIPATCCLCEGDLLPGQKYVCTACSEERAKACAATDST